jgi:hypothetical protein
MRSIARLDFGNCEVYGKPGWLTVGRVYCSPRVLWVNEPREVWRPGHEDPLLLSFVQAPEGELRLGLPPGCYTLKLSFYDAQEEHGPFSLAVASVDGRAAMGAGEQRVILAGVTVPRGQVVTEQADVTHSGGALALRFKASAGKTFLLNALEVLGPEDAELQMLFDDAPSDILPAPAELLATGRDDPRPALREVCDWLMAHRRADGFLGDPEGERRWWYTSAYPIRTLLAGSEIFGEERYRVAAQEVLDLFVLDQMPEGGFPQSFQGRGALAARPEAELDAIRAKTWMNLADIGSTVSALAFAIRYTTGERQARYRAAVKKYLDVWAPQFQQGSGGFTNGWLAGHRAQWIYSIATGTTALSYAFYAAATGEPGYIEVAERAAQFLVRDWHPDGRPYIWPFDWYYPGAPFYMRVRDIGEQFYILDAIAGVASVSRNEAVRRQVFDALRKYLLGSQGLIATWDGAPWWPIQDTWNNSKSAATPLFLAYFLRVAPQYDLPRAELAQVEEVYRVARRFLCTPAHARQIGVMENDPDLPWGGHSLMSWTGCAVAATGFAGLALADMVEPGISYLG